jgi:hypothetical protein
MIGEADHWMGENVGYEYEYEYEYEYGGYLRAELIGCCDTTGSGQDSYFGWVVHGLLKEVWDGRCERLRSVRIVVIVDKEESGSDEGERLWRIGIDGFKRSGCRM